VLLGKSSPESALNQSADDVKTTFAESP
jgi:hypothetical protein